MTGMALPTAGSKYAPHPWRGALHFLLILVTIGAMALVTGQVAIASLHPAGQGSIGAVNVVAGESCDAENSSVLSCVASDYASGKSVAMAFSIRNNGPIVMTVESVQPIGADLVPLIALYPALPADDQVVSWTNSRPFEPVEVAAGEEKTILMIGTMSDDCETVGANWMADGGLIVDHALMTVRWGLVGSYISLPFVSALEVHIPHDGACSGT